MTRRCIDQSSAPVPGGRPQRGYEVSLALWFAHHLPGAPRVFRDFFTKVRTVVRRRSKLPLHVKLLLHVVTSLATRRPSRRFEVVTSFATRRWIESKPPLLPPFQKKNRQVCVVCANCMDGTPSHSRIRGGRFWLWCENVQPPTVS